jgi:hypothetical protein
MPRPRIYSNAQILCAKALRRMGLTFTAIESAMRLPDHNGMSAYRLVHRRLEKPKKSEPVIVRIYYNPDRYNCKRTDYCECCRCQD